MIKINKLFDFPKVELFDKNGSTVGIISNDCELTDVQCQIAKNNLEGYYFIVDDDINSKTIIESNGELDFCKHWDFLQKNINLFLKLKRIQRENK